MGFRLNTLDDTGDAGAVCELESPALPAFADAPPPPCCPPASSLAAWGAPPDAAAAADELDPLLPLPLLLRTPALLGGRSVSFMDEVIRPGGSGSPRDEGGWAVRLLHGCCRVVLCTSLGTSRGPWAGMPGHATHPKGRLALC